MANLLLRVTVLTMGILTGTMGLLGQNQYSNYMTMTQKIEKLNKKYGPLCSVKSLVRTSGGKDIWVMTIGSGEKDEKPGIAVLGGVDGSYVVGKELAFGFAESLLGMSATEEIKELIDKITFYVFPDVSPDATEQFFSELKYERSTNARATDDDRDFVTDEDPYDDLNKDGYITLIRVKDPAGEYIESNEDPRIMVRSDLSRGQTGKYRLFTEGIDNDKDGNFNEDIPGGVNFNRNFTYNYEEFGINAGLYPVSEPETKAVADFLFDRFNIYSVFTFGPQDNLLHPMKFEDQNNMERRITSITKMDELINKLVSDRYKVITGVKGTRGTTSTVNPPGNFMDWAYFHYGRYSFGTPAWLFPMETEELTEAEFLRTAGKTKTEEIFIPWTKVIHPDFPGKLTEVGGIKPFTMKNPPADSLGDLISRNFKFITAIAKMHPELEFLDINTEDAGENIFRISLKLHNKGIFATCAEIGENNQWTRIMRIALEPGKGQSLLAGRKTQRVKRLEGGESAEFSWLIKGKGMVTVNAGAVNTGTITSTLDLK